MKNFLLSITKFLLSDGDDVVSPLYDAVTLIGPYAIATVLMLSTLWGIFLGVKYAKAEDAAEKANLHQVLVNYLIGAMAVIMLISILYAIRGPIVDLIES